MVHDPKKGEAHVAKRADEDADSLIQPAVWTKASMRRLVQRQEMAVHEVRDDKGQRDGGPKHPLQEDPKKKAFQ